MVRTHSDSRLNSPVYTIIRIYYESLLDFLWIFIADFPDLPNVKFVGSDKTKHSTKKTVNYHSVCSAVYSREQSYK